ncbi:MAG: dihydropteroate synthase [Muribaculaceae bacterium]|nr:dihydropteroate synthase [Muribaculaceae bacterium]
MIPFTLNINGRLVGYDRPAVMGIINATPDSFFAGSRTPLSAQVAERTRQMVDEGADMIDLGAYSSRPGAGDVSEAEECRRLREALESVRSVSSDIPVSVDTFRSGVAAKAVTEWGADIVNDISGGTLDDAMFETVAALGVPYILMHMRGTPADMQTRCDYADVTADVIGELSVRLHKLSLLGVNDVIIDPGFGFSKTLEQNYRLLRDLDAFNMLGRPVLAGMSRKSMISRLLGIDSGEALNGTTAVNMLALDRGAAILRVHDVRAAREAVEVYSAMAGC